MRLARQPLIRLLAVNLLGGAAVAGLMLGGLLALNPGNLRGLIQADRSPGTALALLAFGFLITFGSAAMGTAIMTLGGRKSSGPPRGKVRLSSPLPRRSRIYPTSAILKRSNSGKPEFEWERVVRAKRGPGEGSGFKLGH